MSSKAIQERFLEVVKNLDLKFPVAEIAEKTGIGQPTVSTYLSGKRDVSLSFLRRFCEVYHIDFDSIRSAKHPNLSIATSHSAPQMTLLLADLMKKQNQLMEMQNRILERQAVNIEEKVQTTEVRTKGIETNLDLVLATVRTLSVRQRGMGQIMLNSLERLEKKAKDVLVAEADKKIGQIERDAHKHGKTAVTST